MTRPILLSSVAIALLMASPYLHVLPGWTPAVATTVAFTALALLGLNLVFGATGMLMFGLAPFMVIPTYVAGLIKPFGVPVIPAVVIGVIAGVVIARLLASFLVRLPGVYLAFGTLGLCFVTEGLARAFPSLTGGASGLVLVEGRVIGQEAWLALATLCLITGTAIYLLYVRGSVLRRLTCIHHDELAAAALGINVTRTKAWIFVIGCAYACVAGTLLSYYLGVVLPEDAGAQRSLTLFGTLIMGGAGSALGPLVGAFIVTWLFFAVAFGGHLDLAIYGIVFLAIILYARNGVLGMAIAGWRSLFRRAQDVASMRTVALPPPVGRGFAGIVKQEDGGDVVLRVGGVGKKFGEVVALSDVSFEVRSKEVFSLVGPNGAGKSTLFNVICGIISSSEGIVAVGGKDIAAVPLHRRAPLIGRSFQVARLVPQLTAVENVMLRIDQLEPAMPETERAARARRQLEDFGLGANADVAISRLGIGRHKLIDIARAAMGSPPLVLMDEPAVGLSTAELGHLAEVVENLRARGAAVVIVEHNIDFVSAVASRGLVLDSGRPITTGPMADILANAEVQAAYFGVLA